MFSREGSSSSDPLPRTRLAPPVTVALVGRFLESVGAGDAGVDVGGVGVGAADPPGERLPEKNQISTQRKINSG